MMTDKSHLVPMMPCVQHRKQSRRSKLDSSRWMRPYIVARNLVAINLTKKEVAAEPRAQGSLRKEYERLERKQTWLLDTVMEGDDVVRNA
eukprot:3973864-Pyramimonas_sp.AAC.1